MKKMTMIALAASAFMAFSCSDDDSGSNNNVALSGKWKLTKITSDQAVDGNNDGTATTNLIAEGGSCFTASYMEFGSNNVVNNFLSAPSTGDDCFTAETEGDYDVDGNDIMVTITYDDMTTVYDYTKNGNKLIAHIPDFYEVELTIGGETQMVALGATVEFTKE